MDINETGMSEAMDAFKKLGPTPPSANAEVDGQNDSENDLNQDDQVEEPIDDEVEQEDDGAEDGEPSEAEEQEEEPASPGLDPPATWDAEAKKMFATLPPEAQRVIADRESNREKAFHAKAQETAQARKQSEALVNEYTNVHRQFAEQLDTLASTIMPQRPNPALLQVDPQAYAYQQAAYEAATAQLGELQQRSAQARQQAEQIDKLQLDQVQRAEAQRIVEAIPEWSDAGKRQQMVSDFEATGRALGYDDELLSQARAVDIIGLKKATEWRIKAEKYEALQSSKMEAVRSAKGKPKVATPGTAQPKGSARAQGLSESMNRLRATGRLDDAAAAFRNLR